MTIQPYQVRFTIGTKVIPPKEAKPIPQPRLSMWEEAHLVRDRFNRKWGRYADCIMDNDPNESRRIEGQARRDRIAAKIIELLQQGPMTSKDMAAKMHETDKQVRVGIRALNKAGTISMGKRVRDGHLWGIVA